MISIRSIIYMQLVIFCIWAGLGCGGEPSSTADVDAGPGPGTVMPPPDAGFVPPVDPPPPLPAQYRRASLKPLFELTPIEAQRKFNIFDVVMNNADFQTNAVTVSADAKLRQIAQQLGAEGGIDPPNLFTNQEQSTRAQLVPFRGNPTDVKIIAIDGQRKAYVPLGGDVTTPGNEVAVVDLDAGRTIKRLTVGLHPQRVFIDEANEIVFVCNQFSNYISVIDARFDELLVDGGVTVEIPSDFYCADLLVVQRNPLAGEDREIDLYVANEYRASVMKYELDIREDLQGNTAGIDIRAPAGQEDYVPVAEISGVGKNPYRLTLDDTESRIYVANNRGGEVAAIDMATASVIGGGPVRLGAPSTDIVQIQDKVYVSTTTPFRGLLRRSAAVNSDVDKPAVEVTGVDGLVHKAHTGAKFDQTESYNFEDLRNGVFTLANDLRSEGLIYTTDDSEADGFFVDGQKQLAGAVPWDVERNKAGNKLYAAMFASDLVQELDVVAGAQFRLRASGLTFATRELPTAVALDEDNNELVAVTWGGDVLERFNLATGERIQEIDLGFANPRYPATTMEAGEYFYSTAKWSNDGDKACSSCHVDRLLTDGVGYANGATAPTVFHQVKPNYNLMTTDQYFWNGSFNNNSYASLAFAAQSRTNCELILFALIEGPSTPAANRVGDAAFNFTADPATDPACRPDSGNINPLDGLPRNLDGEDFFNLNDNVPTIAQVIAAQKEVAFQNIAGAVLDQLERANLPATREAVSRSMDFYGAAELRLPPNPIKQMYDMNMIAPELRQQIDDGRQIFRDVGCADCHDPDDNFFDKRDHGLGGGWVNQFAATYDADPVLLELLPDGIPAAMEQTLGTGFTDVEINYHYNPLDFFEPFCFDENLCLRFDDPLTQNGEEEDRRLRRLTIINLADPDRGFVPGQVVGVSRTNTPSLRGVWLQHNLLRHGESLDIKSAILPPGHAALAPGQIGFAIDARGEIDVHGRTSTLSPKEVEALEWYVRSIE